MSKLLDGIINTIFGPDTSAMSEADAAKTEKQRSTDRQSVASQAFKVQNDQGASYIDGSEAVAAGDSKSGLLESIGKIFKLFAPTGGGGA
jgi:hypothetical protein